VAKSKVCEEIEVKARYRELSEIAKTYSYSEILRPVGFVLVAEKNPSDGSDDRASSWENSDTGTKVQIVTGAEDKDCYLISLDGIDHIRMDKLELIKQLHAGGDWNVMVSILENRTPIRKNPLAEIGLLYQESQESLSEMTLEKRMEADTQYRELVKRKRTELEVMLTAKKELEKAESFRNSKEFLGLSDDELQERIGFLKWNEIWDLPKEVDWCVPGVISFGRSHLWYGASGMGKSLVVQEIAACAATGKSILGFPAIEPIKVLYLDNENTPLGDVIPRLEDMGFQKDELDNLAYLSFPQIPSLNLKEGGEIFTQLLERFQPKLVILDTFSRFVDGDENQAITVQEFYKQCGIVMKRLKVAYIRIDHMGKDEEKKVRGTIAKRDDVDLIWKMKEVTPNSRFELINEKSRIPLFEKKLILDRATKPLAHRILSGTDWISLINKADSADKALEFVKQYAMENPTSRLGRTAVWKALKPRCISEGIDRKTLWDSIERYRLGDSYTEDYEEISLEI
jgi:hypothetical protein